MNIDGQQYDDFVIFTFNLQPFDPKLACHVLHDYFVSVDISKYEKDTGQTDRQTDDVQYIMTPHINSSVNELEQRQQRVGNSGDSSERLCDIKPIFNVKLIQHVYLYMYSIYRFSQVSHL